MFEVSQAHMDKAWSMTKYGLAGAVIVAATAAFWPGWSLETTIKKRVAVSEKTAVVRVLAQACAQKFRAQADMVAKAVELKGIDSWKRDAYLVKGGYVIKSGLTATDTDTGEACANLLNDLTK